MGGAAYSVLFHPVLSYDHGLTGCFQEPPVPDTFLCCCVQRITPPSQLQIPRGRVPLIIRFGAERFKGLRVRIVASLSTRCRQLHHRHVGYQTG